MGVEWILNLTLNEADMITFSCPLWVSSYFRMRTFYSPSRQHFCHLVKRLKVVGITSKMRHLSQGTVGEEVKQEAFLMTSSEHLEPATPEANNPWPFQIHESPHPLSKRKKKPKPYIWSILLSQTTKVMQSSLNFIYKFLQWALGSHLINTYFK